MIKFAKKICLAQYMCRYIKHKILFRMERNDQDRYTRTDETAWIGNMLHLRLDLDPSALTKL